MAGRWLGRRGWRGAGVLGDARVDVGAADDGVAGVVAVEPAAAALLVGEAGLPQVGSPVLGCLAGTAAEGQQAEEEQAGEHHVSMVPRRVTDALTETPRMVNPSARP